MLGPLGFWDDHDRREATRARFENRMAIPVLVAAALLTVVTLVLVLGSPTGAVRVWLIAIDLTIWAFFGIEYVVRLVITPHKRRFLREEWFDLLLVVLPIFQPARLVGAVLRIARLSAAMKRARRGAYHLLRRHKLDLALAWSLGLVTIASVVTPIVEPSSSKIKGFGDGVWWSLVTTTTVGYGDLVPESAIGKWIGVLLMVVGIGIIGLITANVASMFLEPPPPDDEDDVIEHAEGDADLEVDDRPSVEQLTALLTRLERIESKLDLLAGDHRPR